MLKRSIPRLAPASPLRLVLIVLGLLAPPAFADTPTLHRHPSGRLVLAWTGEAATGEFERVVLIDFDGPDRGEAATGADWLVDASRVLAHDDPDGRSWQWREHAPVSRCVETNRTRWTLLPAPPAPSGRLWVRPARLLHHRTADHDPGIPFTLADLPADPVTCPPAPLALPAWHDPAPRLAPSLPADLAAREWTILDTAAPAPPPWDAPGFDAPLPVSITLIDRARPDEPLPLATGTLARHDPVTRWSGTTRDLRWDAQFTPHEDGSLDVTVLIEGDDERALDLAIGVTHPDGAWSGQDRLDPLFALAPDSPETVHRTAPLPLHDLPVAALPLGVITDGTRLIAVENDPHEPRAFRIVSRPRDRWFGLVYTTALTPATPRLPGRTAVRCTFTAHPVPRPAAALRTALASLYDRTPALQPRPALDPAAPLYATAPAEPWFIDTETRPGETLDDALTTLALLATTGGDALNARAAAAQAGFYHHAPGGPPVARPRHTVAFAGFRFPVALHPALDHGIATGTVLTPAVLAAVETEQTLAHARERIRLFGPLDALTDASRDPAPLAAADLPLLPDPATGLPRQPAALDAFAWLSAARHRLAATDLAIGLLDAHTRGPLYLTLGDRWVATVPAAGLDPAALADLRIAAGPRPADLRLDREPLLALSPAALETLLHAALRLGLRAVWTAPPDPAQPHRTALQHRYDPLLARLAAQPWQPAAAWFPPHPDLSFEYFGHPAREAWVTLHHHGSAPLVLPLPGPALDGIDHALDPLTGRLHAFADPAGPPRLLLAPGETRALLLFSASDAARLAETFRSAAAHDAAAAACLANLLALAAERAAGIDLILEATTGANESPALALRLTNRGDTPLRVERIAARLDGQRRSATPPDAVLPPGATRTFTLAHPSPPATLDLQLTLRQARPPWTTTRHLVPATLFAPPVSPSP